jgi:transketolase
LQEGVINAPIPLTQIQLEDLRTLVLRNISKDQALILNNIPRVPVSITLVLREISKEYKIPLSRLRENAQELRGLNLIAYGEYDNFSGVRFTALGVFISELVESHEPSILENMVKTRTGLRPFGSIIKDLRKTVLRMIAEAGSGHLGASLSAIDIIAVLYFLKMRHDPNNPYWVDRDRFILSKGHAAPALYAVLAEAGYFSEKELLYLRDLGSLLQGHPESDIPGVDVSTGSLGQGLSHGVGMALAGKMNESNYKVYVLLGDGELNEGQIWEAALTAASHNLGNLVAVVDRNVYQLTGKTEEVKPLEPLKDKLEAFGWVVLESDGNDPEDFLDALEAGMMNSGKPVMIIAKTVKGKGISFMEGNKFSRKTPSREELVRALAELT